MTSHDSRRSVRGLSLKARLGFGAALLGAGTLLTAGILHYAMTEVADRIDSALASETRMARYATLSTQAATFLVIASEAVQSGRPVDVRMDRIASVDDRLRSTLALLREDVERAVEDARERGIDEQSRYGTQSLGIARMEAMLGATLDGLAADTDDRVRLRAEIDRFASSFDPLLNQAVNTEVLFRNGILTGIEELRRTLLGAALAIACLTLIMVGGFYLGLIRPQFRRLGRLAEAARRIGKDDFAVALPAGGDEIGQLFAETNRMAGALRSRREEVRADWARLNDLIAQRTEDLRAANAKLEMIDETRRRLFTDLSHELRTPLTVILMEAQLGLKGAPDSGLAFRNIEARAARLNRRIDDLLRVARSDSGQLALEIAVADLPDVAEDVVAEVRAELDNAGMELDLVDVPAVPILCDRNWLRQTLVSLVRNTIRHARSGGRVRLAPVVRDRMAGLAVIDNGAGIPAAEQRRVFERFAQAGQGNSQGFGVGLALARWVTEDQDGEIALQSPVPRGEAVGDAKGTKIAVLLPRAER